MSDFVAPIALRHADSDSDVAACFPAMAQLRPHITDPAELVTRLRRQRAEGYHLLAGWRGDVVVAAAGYRFVESLIHGRFVYLDDLVTLESERSHGIGAQLIEAVANEGDKSGCARLVLDTGLANVLAHRFYYRQGLLAHALRFSRPLNQQ
jgi:GNAT superfamily N-acetyltransferase